LKLVEFYEVIGRVAENIYKYTSGFTMTEKIELLLDKMLPIINCVRKAVNIDIEDSSCSDEEY